VQTFLIYFISSLINIITIVYIQKSMLNKKFNFNNYRNYLVIIIMAIFLSISWIYISGFVRFLVATLLMSLMCFMLFDEKFHHAFIVGIMQQTLFFLAELIWVLILAISKIDFYLIIINQNLLTILVNVIICVIAILVYKIPVTKRLCNNVIRFFERIDSWKKYLLLLFLIATTNILLMIIYLGSENKNIIIINSIFIVIYSFIVYLLMNEKDENIKFKTENKMLLDNLSEYEKMLDYQRVNNHENKNQLLVIKGLIHKNNKNALEYINEIITEQREDNENLFTKAKRIPSGGLQGLIYQKMLYMKEQGINLELDVNKNLKEIKFSNIDAKSNYDLCRAIGILIDNAIEETLKINSKEISVYMYKDGKYFIVEISNYFKDLSLDKINTPGYTTKGKGHGYGLSLLNKIIKENHNIENENRITKDIFTQVIKIKM